MRKHFLLILSLALLAGCAARPNLENTEAAPTYGTKSAGDRFTAANHNELYNSAVAAAADITTLQGYWAIVHAITGIVECDGAGTCAAADNISITGPAGAVGDEVVSVTSDTSRDLAEFRGNVAAEDINIRVTSNAADSSSGYWMSLVGQNKGGGISTGTVGGTTELAIGVGAAPTNNFWEVMTGTKVKHVMAEDAPSLYQRAAGFGFGVEPSEFFHIEENSSRTNSVGNVLRIDAVTDQDMVDGFGAQALFYAEDTAAVSNPIAAIAAVRSGADNSGALVLKTYSAGSAGDALELGADKTATFYGTIIHPAPVTTGTVTDSGDGNPANGTVTAAANTIPQSVVIDCQDADGCTMTMSETGAVDGMRLRVFSSTSSAGNMTFATSSGVQSVRTTRTIEPGESIEFEYRTSLWQEISESTGQYSDFDGTDITIGGCTGAADTVACTATEVLLDQDTDMGTGTLDLSGKTITFPAGGLYFSDEDSAPSVVGQFKYDNTVTGLVDGSLGYHNGSEVRYLLDYATLPTTTGQLPRYNSSTQKWVPTLDTEAIGIACSDETTDLTTGLAKVTFRMPYAFALTGVRANVSTAPAGSTIIVDINEAGSTIMDTTKLSIDASEETSTTAAAPAVLSDTSLADDAKITIDIDQVGSGTAGAGLKVWLIGVRQ